MSDCRLCFGGPWETDSRGEKKDSRHASKTLVVQLIPPRDQRGSEGSSEVVGLFDFLKRVPICQSPVNTPLLAAGESKGTSENDIPRQITCWLSLSFFPPTSFHSKRLRSESSNGPISNSSNDEHAEVGEEDVDWVRPSWEEIKINAEDTCKLDMQQQQQQQRLYQGTFTSKGRAGYFRFTRPDKSRTFFPTSWAFSYSHPFVPTCFYPDIFLTGPPRFLSPNSWAWTRGGADVSVRFLHFSPSISQLLSCKSNYSNGF